MRSSFLSRSVLVLALALALALIADASDVEVRQVTSVYGQVTSDIASIFSQVTSEGAGVFETITSVGGSVVTIITSEGGQAITLATSGAGQLTSFGGSEYTAATAAISSAASSLHANAAVGEKPFEFASAVLVGLFSVLGGVFVGAWITL